MPPLFSSLPRLGRIAEQVGQLDAQHAGDEAQVENGDVALAALDGADEGAVQPAPPGQPCPAEGWLVGPLPGQASPWVRAGSLLLAQVDSQVRETVAAAKASLGE